MKFTDKLGLPIWNEPETDVFNIQHFNKGMKAIDDIVIDILKQIDNLVIGDTQIDLNGYVKEEVLKVVVDGSTQTLYCNDTELCTLTDCNTVGISNQMSARTKNIASKWEVLY